MKHRSNDSTGQGREPRQLSLLADLGAFVVRGHCLQDLMQRAVEGMARELDVEFAKVLEFEDGGESLLLRAGIGWDDGLVGNERVAAGRASQAGYTLVADGPVVVEDLRQERRFADPPLLLDHGVASGVSVVIGRRGHAFGVLAVHSRRRRRFAPFEVTFVQAVANMLAVAVEMARSDRAIEAKYRQVIEGLRDVFFRTSLDGEIQEVSPSVEGVYGYTRAEVLCMSAQELYDEPADRPALLSRLVADGVVNDYELRVRHRDGSAGMVSVNAHLVRDEAGEPAGVAGFVRDIRARKRLEEQLFQAQKLEAVALLAGGIAHDFNNILTGIKAYTQFAIAGTEAAPAVLADLRTLDQCTDRAIRLTGQLLTFSRRQEPRLEVFDPGVLVDGVADMLGPLIGEDIDLDIQRSETGADVFADRGHVEQVLMNLAINARDAMPDGGRLTITTSSETQGHPPPDPAGLPTRTHVRISVADTGNGMSPSVRARAFDPFFTTKPPGKGTGLGLSTVYGIVEQHGGHIRVDSYPDRGTTVSVFLPVATSTAGPAETAAIDVAAGGSESILVLEDDESVRAIVSRCLRDLGYRVIDVGRPEEARELPASHHRIDLLVADVIVPGGNGIDVFHELAGRMPGLRVLFMSGYPAGVGGGDHPGVDHRSRVGERLASEGFPILGKPFTLEALARRVRNVLDEADDVEDDA